MIEIIVIDDIAPALFRAERVQAPSSLRACTMLNGDAQHHVYVDDAARPAWAVVQEVALARKLGYRREQPHRVLAWNHKERT